MPMWGLIDSCRESFDSCALMDGLRVDPGARPAG